MKIKITSKHGRKVLFEGRCKKFETSYFLGDKVIEITYYDEDVQVETCCDGRRQRITALCVPLRDDTKIQIIDSFNA